MRRRLLLPALVLVLGCSAAPKAPPAASRGLVREGTPDAVNLALARAKEKKQFFTWQSFSPETFARARAERKFILLDGAASWCHWCHVMDETTYLDERVGRLLHEKFVAIRVDIDERPDIGERYADWGWPATILLSPDAEEIGKYRGYLPPDELLPILEAIAQADAESGEKSPDPARIVPAPEALPWIAARVSIDMDRYFDREQGSWGDFQKSPLGANVQFELRRAAHGDALALRRAVFTLEKQRAILDPVWGGIYQYSAGSTWTEPHYEKLMPYQAANLEAYAAAHKAAGRKDLLEDARGIARYLSTFLSNAEGGFLVSQDADVGAHEEGKPFIDGDVYYRLDDAGRRKLGIPRIDEHVYAYENGLAIAAMCTLFEASGDKDALARAERAAALVMASHVGQGGAVEHDAKNRSPVHYLADAAGFGRALVRLFEVTQNATYRDTALRIAETMEKTLLDEATGAYFAHTKDPSAVGVFARRERPFVSNTQAARFLAGLGRITGDQAFFTRAKRTLVAIGSPRGVAEQGRMVGEFLLALDEAGVFPWPGAR
ncbi:DUF255 domain-containing protein [Polyangium jinanense]|uniref:Thioredoxin domain-containing protein n=1 Tax=Polyangium jinanense TaxID=2829994 RepID=A0A9X3X353_9BACT|nr:DUF255 domain-containing protein [Polyangium jinanense]MDC3954811.1 thioredoxin domain-containing protein [Polyangium jinanense]MDC3981418.1 thioredoxin domain-containing protein [Polyangium jinanense]